MFKNRSLEIEMIQKAMQILGTVIVVHLTGIAIRICQYILMLSTTVVFIWYILIITLIIIEIFGNIEGKYLTETQIAHLSPSRAPSKPPARLHTKWNCVPTWISYVWTIPGDGVWRVYIFIRSCWTGVFRT